MTRRYLFLFYPDLISLNIGVLEQISDRIFILTSEEVEQIPMKIVKALQQLGKSIRWVMMESDEEQDRKMNLSFLLGKLHERVPTDIEFAIINNSDDYDGFISFVNRSRRTCMRVSTNDESIRSHVAQPAASVQQIPVPEALAQVNHHIAQPMPMAVASPQSTSVPLQFEKPTVDEGIFSAAARIRERMLRSGNRPAELELLKEYIILSTPNLQPGTADKVIDILAINKDIEIENLQVLYHF
jgi:hypothetical protein